MKKQFLALSLVAVSGLFAQDKQDNKMSSQQSTACSTCCCTPCCCKPCCVPKPKKCINCDCYNPMFYDLQCDCGFFASVDFLYWYARETNLSYALKVVGLGVDAEDPLSNVAFAPSKYKNLNTKWDPGFRVGIGWNDGCDGWDYYLHWTYMHNHKSNIATVDQSYALNGTQILLPDEGEFAFISQWVNPGVFTPPSALNPAMVTFDTAKAKWKLKFNSIDLELGRKYWTSPCFNMRPFVGIRGAWTKVDYRTILTRTNPLITADEPLSFKDTFDSRVWGVGMLAGLQPAWYFCQNIVLFGNVDVALIWGEFEVKKKEYYLDPSALSGEIINWQPRKSANNFFQMTPILDLAIGLRWEETWCCEQYRSALDIGWEHHVWFDQNHRGKLVDYFFGPAVSAFERQATGFRTFDEATGNLILGGLVVRLKVDF